MNQGELNRNKAEYYEMTLKSLHSFDAGNGENTCIVRSDETGELFVKKEVSFEVYNISSLWKKVDNIHVADIFDSYETLDGKYFVLEEFINGKTLHSLLLERGTLSEEEAVRIIEQVLDGLSAIHSYGIVHRDIKPENIMISSENVVKIVDLGISRVSEREKSRDTRILGTEGFAAPEQFGFSQTDQRTDIYAAGVLLNVMLTGAFPNDIIYNNSNLYGIIKKATMMDPGSRYESAEKMKTALYEREGDFLKPGWPGFRTGVLWKKIIAGISYGAGLFLFIIFLADAIFIQKGWPFKEIISAAIVFLICPVLWGNVFYWDHFFSKYLKFPRPIAVSIRIILVFALFVFGMELDIGVSK